MWCYCLHEITFSRRPQLFWCARAYTHACIHARLKARMHHTHSPHTLTTHIHHTHISTYILTHSLTHMHTHFLCSLSLLSLPLSHTHIHTRSLSLCTLMLAYHLSYSLLFNCSKPNPIKITTQWLHQTSVVIGPARAASPLILCF